MKKLIEVLEVQSYSGQDHMMRDYLEKELATIPGVYWFDDGINIYVEKGVAPFPCMVAHMDTVHKLCEDLTAVNIHGRITGINAVTMEQTGIGGDDKVGIYIALEMLREHDNLKVFFASDEEIGCVGSAQADVKWFDDVTIALQCDRRGNTDFITNASGTRLSSDAFQFAIQGIVADFGYKFGNGMMTDVMELKQLGIECSMANMSCGYYNPHEDTEYVDVAHVHKTMLMVSAIIKEVGSVYYPSPYVKEQRNDFAGYNKNWWRGTDDKNPLGREWNWWDDSGVERNKRALEYTGICQDCGMQPATGVNGLCDECWDWVKYQTSAQAEQDRQAKLKAVMNAPQVRVITSNSLAPKPTPTPAEATFNFKGKRYGKRKKKRGYKH